MGTRRTWEIFVTLFMCMCVESEDNLRESHFSPFTIWVLGPKLRPPGLTAPVLLSLLSSPYLSVKNEHKKRHNLGMVAHTYGHC